MRNSVTHHETLDDRHGVAVCNLERQVQRAVAAPVARLERLTVTVAKALVDLLQVPVLKVASWCWKDVGHE